MTILRVSKRDKNFLILDKTCLSDVSLSWGAKGLHAYLIGMPDNWQVKVWNLTHQAKNGRDAVRGFLRELEEVGYITKSLIRDLDTGKMGGIEYVVHERPVTGVVDDSPRPGNPSVDEMSLVSEPQTGFQSPVFPSPGKATVINNKVIKYKIKTAAEEEPSFESSPKNESLKTAAAFSSEILNPEKRIKSPVLQNLDFGNKTMDVLIGDKLTGNQEKRIDFLVQEVAQSASYEIKEKLKSEITHCILSQNHFTRCGQEFAKKLNAIRSVIRKGEWETPSSLLIKSSQVTNQEKQVIEKAMGDAYQEMSHFERLSRMADESTKPDFERYFKNANDKFNDARKKLEAFQSGLLEKLALKDSAQAQ